MSAGRLQPMQPVSKGATLHTHYVAPLSELECRAPRRKWSKLAIVALEPALKAACVKPHNGVLQPLVVMPQSSEMILCEQHRQEDSVVRARVRAIYGPKETIWMACAPNSTSRTRRLWNILLAPRRTGASKPSTYAAVRALSNII